MTPLNNYTESECSQSEVKLKTENDKALELLTEAVDLYESLNKGLILSNMIENVEKASKFYSLQPSIILYAINNGVLTAHKTFLKQEFRCVENDITPSTPDTLPPPDLSEFIEHQTFLNENRQSENENVYPITVRSEEEEEEEEGKEKQ